MITLNYSNKKSLDSQKKIYKGLRQILLTKPLSEISVTDISNVCNISRTTFYRNFNNVLDVLDVIFDYYYDRYLNKRIGHENQILFFFEYWNSHKDLVNILKTQANFLLEKIITRYSKSSDLKLKIDLFSNIICNWSINNKISPEEYKNKIVDILTRKAISILLE